MCEGQTYKNCGISLSAHPSTSCVTSKYTGTTILGFKLVQSTKKVHKVAYDTELSMLEPRALNLTKRIFFLALMLLSRCFSLRARQYCDELIKQWNWKHIFLVHTLWDFMSFGLASSSLKGAILLYLFHHSRLVKSIVAFCCLLAKRTLSLFCVKRNSHLKARKC